MPQVDGRPIEYVGQPSPLSGEGMYAKVEIVGSGIWSSTLETSKRKALESLARILAARFEAEYRISERFRTDLDEVLRERDKLQLEVTRLFAELEARPSAEEVVRLKTLAGRRSRTIENLVNERGEDKAELARLYDELAAVRFQSPDSISQHRDELAELLKDRNKKIDELQTEIDGLRVGRIARAFDNESVRQGVVTLIQEMEDKLAHLAVVLTGK